MAKWFAWIPAIGPHQSITLMGEPLAGMTRTRSIEPAQELVEIAVARLRRRRFESSAERGGNAGVGGRDVHSDDSPIHVHRLNLFTF